MSDESSEVRLAAVRGIKALAKSSPQFMGAFLNVVVPPLMNCVKDRTSLPVKLASERAVLHVLKIQQDGGERLAKYVSESAAEGTMAAKDGKTLTDYCRRVLAKLSPDSGDEDEYRSEE